MASELKVDKFTGVTTAGSIDVTGEGNSTTTNLQQGLAKTWVNFNGDTDVSNDSLNVGSITDDGTADYSINFTNNMGNTGYLIHLSGGYNGSSGFGGTIRVISTSETEYETTYDNANHLEFTTQCFSTHGDLA